MEPKPTDKTKSKTADFTDREDIDIINRWQGASYHTVSTDRGFVLVEASSFTRLMFVQNGRLFTRLWKHTFSPRTLTRLAKTFVEDVAT